MFDTVSKIYLRTCELLNAEKLAYVSDSSCCVVACHYCGNHIRNSAMFCFLFFVNIPLSPSKRFCFLPIFKSTFSILYFLHIYCLTVSTHNHYIGQVSKYWFSLCHVNSMQSWWLWYSFQFLRANMIWNDIIYFCLSYIFLGVYFHRCFVRVKTAQLLYKNAL